MGNNPGHTYDIIAIIIISILLISGLFQIARIFYPDVGEPGETYDCDDATLDMYRHFEKIGLEAIPIVGNLDLGSETYTQSNHVWLLVKYGQRLIAYDWGKPYFDSQHYEGYKISYEYLLYAVQQDEKSPDLLSIANYKEPK